MSDALLRGLERLAAENPDDDHVRLHYELALERTGDRRPALGRLALVLAAVREKMDVFRLERVIVNVSPGHRCEGCAAIRVEGSGGAMAMFPVDEALTYWVTPAAFPSFPLVNGKLLNPPLITARLSLTMPGCVRWFVVEGGAGGLSMATGFNRPSPHGAFWRVELPRPSEWNWT